MSFRTQAADRHSVSELNHVDRTCLSALERIIGQAIRYVETLSWDTVGYTSEHGRVIGLSMFGCGLKEIPEQVGVLTALECLSFRDNSIVEFPQFITGLPRIKVISCERNEIRSLPSFCNARETLESLYFAHNKISELPHDIGELRALTILDLDQNDLQYLPESVGSLASLLELNLGSKKFMTKQKANTYDEAPLREYTFENRTPRSPFELQSILFGQTFNRIETLPGSIGDLSHLKTLSIVSNRLSALPDTICKLNSIKEIDLSYNELDHLPQGLGMLPNLESLDVSYNRLSLLPASIKHSATLRRLQFTGNPCADGKTKQVQTGDV
jgi:leucine-rich repeat protein SHOC2